MLTIDTSVWVAAVTPSEASHETCRLFLDQVVRSETLLFCPTLLTVELYAAMARRGDTEPELMEMIGVLNSVRLIHWVVLDENFAERASAVAVRTKLRSGDAIHAAKALEFNCTLISNDREHLERLARVVRVITPAAALLELMQMEPPAS